MVSNQLAGSKLFMGEPVRSVGDDFSRPCLLPGPCHLVADLRAVGFARQILLRAFADRACAFSCYPLDNADDKKYLWPE